MNRNSRYTRLGDRVWGPFKNFAAMNRNFIRGFDPQTNCVAVDSDDPHRDLAVDLRAALASLADNLLAHETLEGEQIEGDWLE